MNQLVIALTILLGSCSTKRLSLRLGASHSPLFDVVKRLLDFIPGDVGRIDAVSIELYLNDLMIGSGFTTPCAHRSHGAPSEP